MKLFVWDGVFADYTAGVAFAMANDADEARSLIADAYVVRYGGRISPDAPEAFRVFAGSFAHSDASDRLAAWAEQLRTTVAAELSGEPRVYGAPHGEFLEGGG